MIEGHFHAGCRRPAPAGGPVVYGDDFTLYAAPTPENLGGRVSTPGAGDTAFTWETWGAAANDDIQVTANNAVSQVQPHNNNVGIVCDLGGGLADMFCEARLATFQGSQHFRLAMAMSDTAALHMISLRVGATTANQVTVAEHVNSPTGSNELSGNPVAGVVYRMELAGTTVEGFIDGVSMGTFTLDGGFAGGGRCGFFLRLQATTTDHWADFRAGYL